jgi:hypothetical protein
MLVDTAKPILYREAWNAPGEPLLAPSDLTKMLEREDDFVTYTDLVFGRDYYTNPIFAHPIPIYPDRWPVIHGIRRNRWEGLEASTAWHPLYWLPERLAKRAHVKYDDGSERFESEHEYLVRLGAELLATGLYHQEDGTWVDVFAMYGLDIDNQSHLSRIEDWLAGGRDEILDNIDLDWLFNHDEAPSIEMAQNYAPTVVEAAAYIAASSILENLESDQESIRAATFAANVFLKDAVGENDEPVGGFFADTHAVAMSDLLPKDLYSRIKGVLDSVMKQNEPAYERLVAAAE